MRAGAQSGTAGRMRIRRQHCRLAIVWTASVRAMRGSRADHGERRRHRHRTAWPRDGSRGKRVRQRRAGDEPAARGFRHNGQIQMMSIPRQITLLLMRHSDRQRLENPAYFREVLLAGDLRWRTSHETTTETHGPAEQSLRDHGWAKPRDVGAPDYRLAFVAALPSRADDIRLLRRVVLDRSLRPAVTVVK